jgi:hypothetical protein
MGRIRPNGLIIRGIIDLVEVSGRSTDPGKGVAAAGASALAKNRRARKYGNHPQKEKPTIAHKSATFGYAGVPVPSLSILVVHWENEVEEILMVACNRGWVWHDSKKCCRFVG